MGPAEPSVTRAVQPRLRLVRVALALVLAALAAMLALYALRTHQLVQQQLRTQAEAGASVAAVRIGHALQHLDDVVVHTRFAFEHLGPGLLENDPLAQAHAARKGLYRFIAVLNATGDPVLVLPPGQALPPLQPLAQQLADAEPDVRRLQAVPLPDDAPSLLLAQRLVYRDGTFAGVAVAALEPAVLQQALSAVTRSDMSVQLLGAPVSERARLAWPGGSAAISATQTLAELPVRADVHGLVEPLQLRVAVDPHLPRQLWWRQLLLPAGVALLLAGLVLAVGRVMLAGIRREAASELKAQAAAAEAAVRSRFLAHMSHEIRTPLNGVLGAVELLAAQGMPAEQLRLVEVMRSSGQSLLALLNDLLDASKIEAGRLQLAHEPFELADCVEDVVVLLAPLAQCKGVRTVHMLHADLPRQVVGDALRLRQVLTNLVGNAVKFTLQGRVVVCCEPAEGGVLVSVQDTGIGIAPEELPSLFTPFSQLARGRGQGFAGTGLGLAIAHSLVQMMGGRIEVQSRPFAGSRFEVWLPLGAPAEQEGPPAPTAAAPRPAQEPVWLVAPEPQAAQGLEQHLLWDGWQPRRFEQLDAAVQAAQQHASSAATFVIDAGALGWSPDQALKRLHQHPGWRLEWHGLLLCDPPPPYPPHARLQCLQQPARRRELAQALRRLHQQATGTRVPLGLPQHPRPARGLRVLAAEDNAVNRMILAEMLAHLGCEADLVDDGAAALQALQQRRYDVVLMDCQMPVLDGLEATRRWRDLEAQRPETPRTVVIALTAYAMAGDRQRCIDAGMDDHLSKPYALQDLALVLQRWGPERPDPKLNR